MSSFIRLLDTEKIRNEIAGYVVDEAFPKALNRAVRAAKQPMVDALLEAFKRTTVWKGLNGDYAGDDEKDIQAQLGLVNDIAQESLKEMEASIVESFDIRKIIALDEGHKLVGNIRGFHFAFNITSATLEGAIRESVTTPEYPSYRTTIPWLDILFGLPVEYNAQIEFALAGISGNKPSRSERAIMVNGGTWDSANFQSLWNDGYDNFIDAAINDILFLDDAEGILVQSIAEQF